MPDGRIDLGRTFRHNGKTFLPLHDLLSKMMQVFGKISYIFGHNTFGHAPDLMVNSDLPMKLIL